MRDRIRALITMAYVVCVDETPLKVGPRIPKPGKIKAERYLAGGLHPALHPTPCECREPCRLL